MLRLVRKDLSAARWFLIAGLPLYVVQLATMAISPPVFLLATFVFTAMLAFGSIALEEVQGTEALWCSVPLSRREVVFGRYATTAVGAVLGLAISFVVGRSVAPILDGARIEPAAYLVLLAILLLLAAGSFPFLFRFGVGRGLTFFSAAAAGLLIAFALIGYLLVPVSEGGPTPEQIEAAKAWLDRSRLALAVAMLAVAAIATAVSAGLSVRFFERRDL